MIEATAGRGWLRLRCRFPGEDGVEMVAVPERFGLIAGRMARHLEEAHGVPFADWAAEAVLGAIRRAAEERPWVFGGR